MYDTSLFNMFSHFTVLSYFKSSTAGTIRCSECGGIFRDVLLNRTSLDSLFVIVTIELQSKVKL